MQAKQMRGVPVLIRRVVPIFRPLLQLAMLSYLQRQQLRSDGLQRGTELGVYIQGCGGCDAVAKQIPDDRAITGRGYTHPQLLSIRQAELVLWRCRWHRDPIPLFILHQPIQAEQSSAFHHRISNIAQIGSIPAECIVLPQMLTQPGPTHRPERPNWIALPKRTDRRSLSPYIGIVMGHPTPTAIVDGCSLLTDHTQITNQIDQGLMAFGQVGGFGQPVIHLGVDVQRPIGAPGWANMLIPNALQVGRLCAGARTGD